MTGSASSPLAGRRAIVTGAAHGLGAAFAGALARAGARVAVCDVADTVHETARDVGAAWSAIADVGDPTDARSFVVGAADALGGLDLVVNNAGVMRRTDPVRDDWAKALDDFDAIISTNYRATFLVGRAAIPHLVSAGRGDIVNVTTDHIHTCGYPDSIDHADAPTCPHAGHRRPPLGGVAFDVYDSSKWALKGLTNVWARALAPHGIRVNSFGMGATDTPMYREHLGDRPMPAGVMHPDRVAAVLVDLITEGPDGRSADCIQLWVGHPCELGPPGLDAQLFEHRRGNG